VGSGGSGLLHVRCAAQMTKRDRIVTCGSSRRLV
jgi:hypothetical protein